VVSLKKKKVKKPVMYVMFRPLRLLNKKKKKIKEREPLMKSF
jgi:hypothetical protein